ncbi:MAG: halocyanin precursor-like protein [Actinomycetia bacterium]|nr:halocyanin precursor-like protein [Actinomycetes bacterium]
MTRSSGVACVFLALGLLLTACGGGSGGTKNTTAPITASNGKVTIVAHDIYFNTKEIDAPPGKLTITLDNQGSQLHTFVIDKPHIKLSTSPHQKATGTVDLTAGTYSFYCDIPGHRSQGMNGQLVVK